MKKKMTIKAFQESEFCPGCAPHRSTVIRRIQQGVYDGVLEGRTWYILKTVSTGNPIADEILSRHAAS